VFSKGEKVTRKACIILILSTLNAHPSVPSVFRV